MYKKQQKILNQIFGQPNLARGESLHTCPKCNHHKKKLSINLSKGVYKCWVCDFSGKNLTSLVRKYGTRQQYYSWSAVTPNINNIEPEGPNLAPKPKLPQEFKSLCTSSVNEEQSRFLSYLDSRGLNRKDVFRWKMGYCSSGKYSGRIIIPSFDSTGELNYFIARSIYSKSLNYLNPPFSKDIIFNELNIDWDSPVVLVEGVFDAMRFENSIPILGSTLPLGGKLLEKLASTRAKVYIGLDADARKKENKIIKNMILYDIEVHKMEAPVVGDYAMYSEHVCNSFKQNANFVEGTDYLLYEKIFSEVNR